MRGRKLRSGLGGGSAPGSAGAPAAGSAVSICATLMRIVVLSDTAGAGVCVCRSQHAIRAFSMWRSFSHDFHDDAFAPLSVELLVKHLFPRPEIERGARDRQHDLVAPDGPVHVGVGVVIPP